MIVSQPAQALPSPWPHRWAWLLACATFPLVWVGGLVTTTNSGMAFRDWLTSDGHFMLVYPWFQSVGEKFIEHGHRLLGAMVGFLSIGLALVVTWAEPRRWVRRFSWFILLAVILQGGLGGMRVVFAVNHDNPARALALIHGCTGPLFLALCVAMVVFTSKAWAQSGPTHSESVSPMDQGLSALQIRKRQKLLRVGLATCVVAYGQLVLGALVRHTPHMTGAWVSTVFQLAIYFHLLGAVLLLFYMGLLVWRSQQIQANLLGPFCLVALVLVQVGLGLSTWCLKYGLPGWVIAMFGEQDYLNHALGQLPVFVITCHVAIGSLISVTALCITLLAARRLGSEHLKNLLPIRGRAGNRLVEVAL